MSDKFEVLTGRDQILKRPQMWVGSMDVLTQNMFVINDSSVEYKEVSFIPAFRKIIDEILDNSLDAIIEHHKAVGTIKVDIDDKTVSIEDDGPGIPVIKKKLTESELKSLPPEEAKSISESYIPQIAWTRLFSGSNFQDSEDKTSIGSHGLGSKCASIFSKKFVGKTDDGKKGCTVTAINNLESSTCAVGPTSGKCGTIVKFWPDLAKFNLTTIEEVYKDLVHQRLLSLAVSFPGIKFYFNRKLIKVNDKSFLNMFSNDIEFQTFDKGFIGVYPNEYDDFKYFSYVNGLSLNRGGSHVDYIINQIVNPIRDKLVKTYKTIKPADIRNKLTLVVFMRDFPNPKFDSQTKETLTNAASEISNYLGNKIDFEKLAKAILKNDKIISPIVDMFKLKEELKTRQELNKVKKVKVSSDKYFAGNGDKKYLFLVEGLSAGGGLMKCFGRDGKSYYCLRGLALNVYDSSMQKIVANQEVKDVVNILGLDLTKSNEHQDINYEKIVIATDADLDGINISSMLFGWWYKLCPKLYEEHKIYKLNTPVVMLKDNKENVKQWFFNLDNFKNWEKNNSDSKLKVIYLKGLGSLETKDLDYIIEQQGFDSLLEEYILDDKSKTYFENWLGEDSAPRKDYIKNYTLDINQI